MQQCINNIQDGPIKIDDLKLISGSKIDIKNTMEGLISHFKYFSEGPQILPSEIYASIEAPKGEFGLNLTSDGSSKIYRCKLKAPGFTHLQASKLFSGQLLADIIAIIGTLDIVFGEVDR